MARPGARALTAAAATLVALLALGAGRAPAREAAPVRGGSSPGLAPLLDDGGYLDTLSAGAPVWYRIAAEPGQPVAATIVVGAAHDGREAQVVAQVHDGPGGPLVQRQTAALNQRGAELDVLTEAPPPPDPGDDEGTRELLLSVRVGIPRDLEEGRATSRVHDVLLAVSAPGDATAPTRPTPASAPPVSRPPARARVEPPEAEEPRPVAEAFPGVLVGLAVGGAAGFEAMRLRLRRRPRPAER